MHVLSSSWSAPYRRCRDPDICSMLIGRGALVDMSQAPLADPQEREGGERGSMEVLSDPHELKK